MQVIQCAACGASNRPQARYCMRCGRPIAPRDCAATRHARDFIERERQGPIFGAFPDALDLSPQSLSKMDALITELWGSEGMAPGVADWQPPPARLAVIMDLGAYLGEVLCRTLPLRWEMDARHPDAVLAARVVDAEGRRINPFAQMGARFRDGSGVGMASLYTALSGRVLPAWQLPNRALPPAAPATSVVVPPAPGPMGAPTSRTAAEVESLTTLAAENLQRGHFGNAVACLRQVLAARPGQRTARRDLILALAHAGAIDDALQEVDAQRRLAPGDVEWTELRALLLGQSGRLDEALGMLDMTLMKQPAEPRLLRRRAFLLLKGQRWSMAAEALGRLLAAGEDAELLVGLAEAQAQLGQADAARQLLERMLSIPLPGRSHALDSAARERLAAFSRPPPSFAAAPAATPTTAGDEARAAQAYAAAIEHARQRRFDSALPLFIEAARCNPRRPAYLKDVGNCLFDLGRSSEAAEWFRRCLALDPGVSAARRMLGVVAEQLGQTDAAITCYREVLARMDSDPREVERALTRLQALGALPGSDQHVRSG